MREQEEHEQDVGGGDWKEMEGAAEEDEEDEDEDEKEDEKEDEMEGEEEEEEGVSSE